MKQQDAIKIFEDKKVRTVWDDGGEKWYFSIIDVIEILVGSERPRKYWNDLKTKLKTEGSQLYEKIGQLKLEAKDGKTHYNNLHSNFCYYYFTYSKLTSSNGWR